MSLLHAFFGALLSRSLVAGIVWFFWVKKARGTRGVMTSSRYQEVMILVKDGTPGPAQMLVQHQVDVALWFPA